jgi:Spy/CpxP family protein refolding chaperone
MTVTVESILRTNCNQCHGTEKQKGGLQILPVSRLHEGPEKFRVIKPGDPAGSLLVQRISLPAGHDDIMPPEGKTLSAAEIKVIEDWITAGAKEADAKTPVAGMTGMAGKGSRGQSTSPRAFLRAYMALKDLTSEQRRAGIAAATKARNGLSAEDKKVMQEVQVMRRAIANGDEIPADLTKRREEIRSRVTALREAGAKAQSDLWALLSPEQQARVREVLDQGTANGQQDRRRERRKGDSPPPPKGPPTAP